MMYNRYIPQPDGTYSRRRISAPAPPPSPPPCSKPSEQPPCPEPKPAPKQQNRCSRDIGSFFSQLLPQGFDTSDLIVVLLLLLMAADSCDEHNTALLTLALYLFL